MSPLAQSLREMGSEVAQLSLSGHETSEADLFGKITRNVWLKDTREVFETAQALARKKQVPLYFLGYSIGAAYAQDLLNSAGEGEFKVERQVLMAPAVALRSYSRLMRLFRVFGPEFRVPTLSYGSYHSHRHTPVAAYDAIFETIEALERSRMRCSNIPTLVIIDPKDELISPSGIQKKMKDFSLSEWKVLPVHAAGSLPITYHHLIVDEFSAGTRTWNQINRAIRTHLFQLA